MQSFVSGQYEYPALTRQPWPSVFGLGKFLMK
jgi:hypothetical protein